MRLSCALPPHCPRFQAKIFQPPRLCAIYKRK